MRSKQTRDGEGMDTSPRISQRDKLKDPVNIREFKWTPKQKEFIDLVLDKKSKIIFVDGVAGTGKTLLAVYCALELLNQKRVSDIIFCRSIIESASKAIGALPGELDLKFKPFLLPLEDKLNELLSKSDVVRLFKDERVQPIPINFLRGASFNAKVIIGEEVQNFTFKELVTLITRLGEYSKLICIGDTWQADLNGKSGFKPMFELFDTEESKENGIYTFKFTKYDIMRSGVLKFVMEKLESIDMTKFNHH